MKGIFEKNDYEKIRILAFMEKYGNNLISVSKIVEGLSLSYFKVVTRLDELMNDLKNVYNEVICIKKVNEKYLYIKNGTDSIDFLICLYASNSPRFLYVDYFLKNENKSIEDFSFDHHMSLSKAYRVSREVNRILDMYGINFFESNNYSEEKLRFFLSDLYFNAFQEYEMPFDRSVTYRVDQLLYLLENKMIIINKNKIDRLKLKFYLCITCFRNETNFYIGNDSEKIVILKEKESEELKKYITAFLANIDDLSGATNSIINYLYVNDFFSDNTVKDVLYNVEMSILQEILSVIITKKTLNDWGSFFKVAFETTFAKLLYFGSVILDSYCYRDFSFLKKNYYELYTICLEIFIENKKTLERIFGKNNYDKYLALFVIKFISIAPTEKLQPCVKIAVDFSLGEGYNAFIGTMIKKIPSVNVIITENFSQYADIYLTDSPDRRSDAKVIVCSTIPTNKDWEVLENFIFSYNISSF
ncbi:hypothetical protein IGL98_003404 [Enterococcus sp. DIV0840]|uniref:helix-turn-helix domain-containing protein n=1 Tax=unclassified Enterococcus TaxID=2608891 RepID=UPI001A8D7FFB|nr:helix-turn-helix domain-containing protein [Enterococcus sp. DIV0849a]MBO0433149.1 helix-turn-helix domain-containing protein [Enterococcus sp. DIV0849a]